MLSIRINPDCFDSTKPVYDASFKALQDAGRSAAIRINIEIPSVLIDFEQIFPRMTKEDRLKGFTSHTFHVKVNEQMVDEAPLAFAGTGLQGAFMFNIAHHVDRGVVIVKDVATGVVRTAAQIRNYAVNGVWA